MASHSSEESHGSEELGYDWVRVELQSCYRPISLYCKAKYVQKIRERLSAIGGADLRDRFQSGCFGKFLSWKDSRTSRRALHALMAREIRLAGAPNHELWFNIGGNNIHISYPKYALVTGLQFGSSHFDPNVEYDTSEIGVFTRFCPRNEKPRIMDLLNRFKDGVVDANHDDYLKVANILALYYFALGYDDHRVVESFAWVLVDNLDEWNRFPWGSYTYTTLRHYVSLLPSTKSKLKKSYHFYGPVWALQVWAFEAIPDLARNAAVKINPNALPQLARWLMCTPKIDDFHGFLDDESRREKEKRTRETRSSSSSGRSDHHRSRRDRHQGLVSKLKEALFPDILVAMKREFVPGLKDALLPDIKEYIKSLWHGSKSSHSQRSRSNEGPPPMHDQEECSQPSRRSVHVDGSHRERDLPRRSLQVEGSRGSRQIEGSRGSQHRDAPRKKVELEGIIGSSHSHAYGPQFSQHVGIPHQELNHAYVPQFTEHLEPYHAYGSQFSEHLGIPYLEPDQASPPVMPCSSKRKQVEESSAPVESRSKEATLAAYKDWRKGPKSS
ncbi:hypothetical protein C2S51_029275 [Perilla frutescens var. frutescens]|nr:hypothetical protein C2S51_029275 [Perilla frutescens var. frutescens]